MDPIDRKVGFDFVCDLILGYAELEILCFSVLKKVRQNSAYPLSGADKCPHESRGTTTGTSVCVPE